MLERSEFALSRAAITLAIFCLICSILGGVWWWNIQNSPPPQTYFDYSSWKRVNNILRFVQPIDTLQISRDSTPKCSLGDSDYLVFEIAAKRFNQQLLDARHRQVLQNSYALDTVALLASPEFLNTRCSEVLFSLNWLIRIGAEDRFVKVLTWKERLPLAVQSRLPVSQWVNVTQQSWTARSPWMGSPGCIFWTEHNSGKKVANQGKSQGDLYCQSRSKSYDVLPTFPGQAHLLSLLAPYRLPQHPLFQRLVGDRNLVTLRGVDQIAGLDVQLTLDPKLQAIGQYLTDCYGGLVTTVECANHSLGKDYFENARVRLAGLAVIDSGSGRILVAASTSSPCYVFDQTRSGRQPSDCPKVDIGTVHSPSVPKEIINHALLTQAPPGSLVKPLMLAGILSQPTVGGSISGIDVALQRSDSQRFLDAFLCRQRLGDGEFLSPCHRPQKALDAAHGLGWNFGCDSVDGRVLSQCGKFDLLHGSPLAERPRFFEEKYVSEGLYQPIQWPTLAGQFLVAPSIQPDGTLLMADIPLDKDHPSPASIARCASSGKGGYSRCKDHGMGLVSEAYGQGNSRATPVGVASMMAAISSSAANTRQHYPYLIEGKFLSDGSADRSSLRLQEHGLSVVPKGIDAVISNNIIIAMEKTLTKGGTAFAACSKVFGQSECLSSLGIAGKTGTPGDIDSRSLAELRVHNVALKQCLVEKKPNCTDLYPLPRPRYRWYAALFKSTNSTHYDKAIAVLVHSNWRRSDGRFSDENSAATEIAMRFILAARALPQKPGFPSNNPPVSTPR
jgi:hypothetical protein